MRFAMAIRFYPPCQPVRSPARKRLPVRITWLACALAASLAPVRASSDGGLFPWRTTIAEGREYVPAADVAAFYRFNRHYDDGWATWFRSPTLAMRWEVDTSVLSVNQTKFILSAPVLKRDGEVLVSRADLVKWIDPLLRPAHVLEAEDFDTVVVDPGHGGLDNGTRGRLGEEKAYALDLGLRLRDELAARGLRVVMTRQSDVGVPKGLRGELATAVGRSVLVSLHFNQNNSPAVHGLETYAMTPVGLPSTNDARPGPEAPLGFNGNLRENASLALAAAVHSQVLHRCGPADRGVRRARFAVLKDAERAGILVEGGYLSNLAENSRIHMPDYRARMARAIAEGVVHYREAVRARPGSGK
jgi:N-acetylmuramoyl-L-alanine amidase